MHKHTLLYIGKNKFELNYSKFVHFVKTVDEFEDDRRKEKKTAKNKADFKEELSKKDLVTPRKGTNQRVKGVMDEDMAKTANARRKDIKSPWEKNPMERPKSRSELKTYIAQLEGNNTALENQVKLLEEEKQRLAEQYAQLDAAHELDQQRLEAYKARLLEQHNAIQQLQNDLTAKQQELSDLQAEKDKIEQELATQQETNEDLKFENKVLGDEIAKKKQQIQDITAQTEADKQALQGDLAAQRSENIELIDSNVQLESANRALNDDAETLADQNIALGDRNEQLLKENARLNASPSEAMKQLREAESALEGLSASQEETIGILKNTQQASESEELAADQEGQQMQVIANRASSDENAQLENGAQALADQARRKKRKKK